MAADDKERFRGNEDGTEVDADADELLAQDESELQERANVRRAIRWSPTMWFIRAATAVFLMVSVGLVLILSRHSSLPQTRILTLNSVDGIVTDTLPDGTKVTLNSHSQLSYPQQFSGNERQVSLQGEAYFDVVQEAARPFRIHAGAADMYVLGSTFNLKSENGKVEVAVQTGSVTLRPTDSLIVDAYGPLQLTAGRIGSYDSIAGRLTRVEGEAENALYWKTNTLVFRNRPLSQVAATLNAVLRDSIVISSDAIRNCPMTIRLERPTISSALALIATTFSFEVIRGENNYEIKGIGCK